MIGKLTGHFDGTTPDGAALIDVGGVGYAVRTPAATLEAMRHNVGAPTVLYVHTSVREDALDLFGFATEEELVFFRQLTSVSGVGPKTGVGILNVSDIGTLKRSIARGDATALTKVFGIGKKSAERIVVELRDKLAEEGDDRGGYPEGDEEVLEALMALGYSASEARKALKELARSGEGIVGVSERIAAALKVLGTRASV
ncbi:MAG: Holliday junction helicase RuvA, holliday junction helicase RuvA [Candidatus Adlerbacteria bacterium]|nr:Holliday junction helicase RuvA, holliday junction helicase RuvA [Candidatus Adlerbacteria bacterium]